MTGNGQNNTVLYTFTFPGTVAGLMWDFRFGQSTLLAEALVWAIHVVRDGIVAPTINSAADNTPLYQPEQNVLAWGAMNLDRTTTGDDTDSSTGRTKTMRKLMGGDTLQLAVRMSLAGSNATFYGAVQFFILS